MAKATRSTVKRTTSRRTTDGASDTTKPASDATRRSSARVSRPAASTSQRSRSTRADTSKQLATLPDVRRASLDELQPDDDNQNRGTERGVGVLEHSVQHHGAGRSILLDKHGRIIAGNKTAEAAMSVGLRDVIIVPTDGTQLVAVQRLDLDLTTDMRARELAIADNRTGELGLSWDAESLKRAQEQGADLSPYFSDEELRRVWGDDAIPPAEFPSADDAIDTEHRCPRCGYEWSGTTSKGRD